jgi:hypothetical protein
MRYVTLSMTLVAGLTASAAHAQPLPPGAFVTQPPSTIVPALPAPAVDDNAAAVDFLNAAEHALSAGRTGETREAMERAQTRLLDRSVPLGQTDRPSDNPAVGLISQGLRALEAGDRATCLRMIQAAVAAIGAPSQK